jgi:hypothetical protein
MTTTGPPANTPGWVYPSATWPQRSQVECASRVRWGGQPGRSGGSSKGWSGSPPDSPSGPGYLRPRQAVPRLRPRRAADHSFPGQAPHRRALHRPHRGPPATLEHQGGEGPSDGAQGASQVTARGWTRGDLPHASLTTPGGTVNQATDPDPAPTWPAAPAKARPAATPSAAYAASSPASCSGCWSATTHPASKYSGRLDST